MHRPSRSRLTFRTPRLVPLAVLPLALACGGGGLSESRHPTGSQSIAASSDYSALYVANEAEGTVSRVNPEAGTAERVEVGAEPSRIARIGNTVFVSLAAERAIAVLEDTAGVLSVVGRIEVGAEPNGLVTSEDGTRLFVAETTQNRVSLIDPVARRIVRSWAVEGQPRWLALHPGGRGLFVVSTYGGLITRIELQDEGDARQTVLVPESTGFGEFGPTRLQHRFTGDPAITPDGRQLLVPGLFVDSDTEVVDVEDGGRPNDDFPGGGYDRGGRFNPVMVVVPLGGDGVPEGIEEVEVVSIATFFEAPLISYPSSVTVDPDGEVALVTMEGSAGVVAVSLEKPRERSPSIFDIFSSSSDEAAGARFAPGGVSFSFRSTAAIGTDRGPNGVAMLGPNRAFVASFLDRTVAPIDGQPVRRWLGLDDDGSDGFDDAPSVARPGGIGTDIAPFFALRAGTGVTVETSKLPDAVERGRRLFFAANDPVVSNTQAGVSCATCHFRGRNDGLTWRFTRGAFQTPSLAGKVSETEPVRWDGGRETVAVDALMTSQGLMGGSGMTEVHSLDLAAFIDSTRDVDLPLRGVSVDEDPRLARGKALFERADVGCASCHSGPRYTDNKTYPMLGIMAQTRSLVGVAASAPYLHDGSASTLTDLLEKSRTNGMGNTSMLSSAEIADLAYYLESL